MFCFYDSVAPFCIRIYKSFVGNYMTSLEMSGCSVTLLKLDNELKDYLDAPCDTTALKVL